MVETSFAETLVQFEISYQAFIDLATRFPVALRLQAGLCGDWSAREVLAHLAGWLQEAQRRYPRYARGTGDMHYQIDTFNAVSVRMRRGKDYETILQEVIVAYQRLIAMAQALTPDKIDRDKRYAEWLIQLTEDVNNHAHQFETFLELSHS